jgi:hypothetical protein
MVHMQPARKIDFEISRSTIQIPLACSKGAFQKDRRNGRGDLDLQWKSKRVFTAQLDKSNPDLEFSKAHYVEAWKLAVENTAHSLVQTGICTPESAQRVIEPSMMVSKRSCGDSGRFFLG